MKVTIQCTILNWKKQKESDLQLDCICLKNVSINRVLSIIENEEQLNELEKVFNTLPNISELDKIQWHINHRLDPNHKGFTELEELVSLVEEQISDKQISLTLTTLIAENLEYKNSDCVFYSPLLSLPPPFFKYGNEIDNIDLIIKLNKELRTLDSHQQGFVPVALFKQVCDRLRIKVKIADDFVECMQPNLVDVNITSNSLNVGLIDYVLLVRKLMKSLPKIREEMFETI